MIQFGDDVLARLYRATKDLPPDRRRVYLKKLAAAVDPSPALRRYRRRNGPVVAVDVAPDGRADLAFFLRAHGVPLRGEDRASLAAGVDELVRRWRRGEPLVPAASTFAAG